MNPLDSERNHNTTAFKARIGELADALRSAVPMLDDPRERALYEVSAEVLIGVRTSFEHYEAHSEPAWK